MRDALLSRKLEEHKVCPAGETTRVFKVYRVPSGSGPGSGKSMSMGSTSFISLVYLVSSSVLKLGHMSPVCLDVNAANTISK